MMVRKSGWIAAVTVLFVGIASSSMAAIWADETAEARYAKNNFELWMQGGVEAWAGDITYRIGYPVIDSSGQRYYGYFPFSELEFPLDAAFGVVKAGAVFGNSVAVNVQLKKNISEPDDEMIDRDWITESRPSRLDIYSESEVTDFSALVLDGDVSYRFLDWDIMQFAAGAGFMYQNFEYETSLIRQWSPSGMSGYDYGGDGSTSLIYEVDATIPYLLVTGTFNVVDRLNINARLALAPWVTVEDEDQHLLRDKVNVGDLEGSAVIFSVDANYDITSQLFVTSGLAHTSIDVDGDMEASFSGVYDHTVEEELTSRQTSVFVTVGFRFGVPAEM